ncbi:MAG TPA: DNA polymerase III subunit beta [Gaiellaceae bacterium]|jgi:DNA polymerase-3 subunit beta|nr:DNA polymerase III subunit beta [Gaiellaceae bacterium]
MIDSETVVGTGLRITVSKDDLAAKLAIVARGVSTRTAVLVLGGIQLRAEAGRLHLAATDMELSLRTSLEASVEGEGTTVVPGRLLLDIARTLPDSEVTIDHRPEEATVVVTSGTANYRLHTYSAEDFPRLPDVDSAPLHTVDRDVLVETVARVGRSASRDESRPVLTGILVQFEPGKVVMAATDSYRLAVKETPVSAVLPELEAIIPARALQELSRIAGGAEELQLGLLENHVAFGAEDTWLTTRRIDGQFPNHRQLLPEQFEHEVLLPREEALEVVRRVSLMAQRNSPLRLRFADGELTVSAVTQDVGEARESLPAPYTAEPLEIGFNAEFLRDGLDSVDSDTVKFKLISPLRPAVLEGESDDYVYLIMPIRLAG